MRAFVMTPERLKHEGYKLENLGKDEILGFRRCRDCHGLFSFLDHLVEQEFISPSVRKILISSPTAEQMIDQLLAYVPKPDPLLSHINWNTKDSRKKQKSNDELDLTLRL